MTASGTPRFGPPPPAETDFPPAEGTTEAYGLAYLEAGWSLIPVRPKDKRPLIAWEIHQQRRAGQDEFRRWLEHWPTMNLGLVTGPISGVVALDLDGEAGIRSLHTAGVAAPATLLQQTPHGYHALYRLGERPVKNAAGLFPHVDVRGAGGYIVVAPSTLADGAYRWFRRLPLVPVPPWMEQRAEGDPAAPAGEHALVGSAADRWVRQALTAGVPEGQRNDTAARLAGYLRAHALPPDVITVLMQPFAQRCTPPMGERELHDVIRSVLRYPPRALRGQGDGGVLTL